MYEQLKPAMHSRATAGGQALPADLAVQDLSDASTGRARVRFPAYEYCIVWTVRDGKVTAVREYCDSALTERALGPFPQDRVTAVA